MQLDPLPGELLLVLLCYLQSPPLHLHGGVVENPRNISLMYQVCNYLCFLKYNLQHNLL